MLVQICHAYRARPVVGTDMCYGGVEVSVTLSFDRSLILVKKKSLLQCHLLIFTNSAFTGCVVVILYLRKGLKVCLATGLAVFWEELRCALRLAEPRQGEQ